MGFDLLLKAEMNTTNGEVAAHPVLQIHDYANGLKEPLH